ncbi:MAG: hypothetical protein AB8B81_05680 [Halioglobus sp.]
MCDANPIKILMSARDPAAALNVAALWQEWNTNSKVLTKVTAQGPAFHILKEKGVIVDKFDNLSEDASYVPQTTKILNAFQPDAVLVGLSAPGEGGVDEALLASAKVPTFLLQDFWGECNNYFQSHATEVFVIDNIAKELTEKRFGVKSTVVGSPKHIEYLQIVKEGQTVNLRRKMNLDNKKVISVFGQSLKNNPGYIESLKVLYAKLSLLDSSEIVVIFRSHPRDTYAEVQGEQQLLASYGLPLVDGSQLSHEESIAISDVCISMFSNSLLDTCYFNYFSNAHFKAPISLLYNESIRSLLISIVQSDELPYFNGSMVLPVHNEDQLLETLRMALTEQTQSRLAHFAKSYLLNPLESSDRILEAIVSRCMVT